MVVSSSLSLATAFPLAVQGPVPGMNQPPVVPRLVPTASPLAAAAKPVTEKTPDPLPWDMLGTSWLLPRPQTVVSLFFAGVALALGGATLAQRWSGPRLAQATEKTLQQDAPAVARRVNEAVERMERAAEDTLSETQKRMARQPANPLEMNSFLTEGPALALRIIHVMPELTNSVMQYAVVGTLGYLATNLFQGLQEAWVRWEESCIRAQLVSRIQEPFRQSIETKQQHDDLRRTQADEQFRQLLTVHQVPNADALLNPLQADAAAAGDVVAHRDFFYMPQNRVQAFGRQPPPPAGLPNPDERLDPDRGQYPLVRYAKPLTKVGAVGAGAAVGWLTHQTVMALKEKALKGLQQNQTPVKGEFMNPYNAEALWFLHAPKGEYGPLLGMLAMGATLGLGRLFVNGLRQIEVTRLNAETEYNYERFKWQQQDIAYHDTAEQLQLNHAMAMLNNWMTLNAAALRDEGNTAARQALVQRYHRIQGNIGYGSPPPYYPITPAVQLVEARS